MEGRRIKTCLRSGYLIFCVVLFRDPYCLCQGDEKKVFAKFLELFVNGVLELLAVFRLNPFRHDFDDQLVHLRLKPGRIGQAQAHLAIMSTL